MSYNASISVSVEGESGESETQAFNFVLFCYVLVSHVNSIVNAYVIYVVTNHFSQYRQKKSVAILVAHLSALSICGGLPQLFNTSNSMQLIQVDTIFCVPLAYLKGVFVAAYSINLASIVYERLQTLNEARRQCHFGRLIGVTWTVALVFNIPTALMVQPNQKYLGSTIENLTNIQKNQGTCIPVKLFGSNYVTALYEFIRFFMFSISVAVFTFCAFIQIRSKMNFLQLFSIDRVGISYNQARDVKRIYFHFVSFFLIWILNGFIVFVHRALPRINMKEAPKFSILNGFVGVALFLYNVLNPLISLILLDPSITWIYKFFFCSNCSEPHTNNNNAESMELIAMQGHTRKGILPEDTSALCTYHVTSAVLVEDGSQSSHENSIGQNGVHNLKQEVSVQISNEGSDLRQKVFV